MKKVNKNKLIFVNKVLDLCKELGITREDFDSVDYSIKTILKDCEDEIIEEKTNNEEQIEL